MDKILGFREKAKREKRKIVLPEGEDKRTIQAAAYIAQNGIADVIVLGNSGSIKDLAEEASVSIGGITVVDPVSDEKQAAVIEKYYQLRKHKGMTPEEAKDILMKNYVIYGAVMSRLEFADGFVAGASHSTGDIARAAIQCIKISRAVGTVSSSFLMEIEDCPFGENGLFIFADCAIIPYPSAKQLAGITLGAAGLFRSLFGVEPRVAMLSYSTKGSASGESIDIVKDALAKVLKKEPELAVDGELQVDSALVREIAEKKCSGSPVAGKANVMIFPNLDAGNIAYKVTERLAGARAVGPLFQGLEKPCSDLSRGCSWEDIVDAVAVTAVRTQGENSK